MTSNLLTLVIRRDLRLASRRPFDALLPVVFLLVSASLFPFGVGPEPQVLQQIAPGVVWVCALLSAMLSLGAMYGGDFADGSLEQMLLSSHSLVMLTLAKGVAHWVISGLPLILVGPLLGLLFGMPVDSIKTLSLSLLIGTPILSLVGGVGAAITLGLRNGAVLILLLVLPLCIPVLIFGAGTVAAVESGISPSGNYSLLAAMLLLTLLGAPVATAAALRISV